MMDVPHYWTADQVQRLAVSQVVMVTFCALSG